MSSESEYTDVFYRFIFLKDLKSILEKGIMPRSALKNMYGGYSKMVNHVDINDYNRFDGCLNATCTSIGFPNYRMFYYYVNKNKDAPDNDWAVFSINAKVLYEIPCVFCRTNAANKLISLQLGDPEKRKALETPKALKNLFEDHEGDPKRSAIIPDYYTTDPQAEVLVFGTIPVTDIGYVYFKDEQTEKKYESLVSSFGKTARVNEGLFRSRQDWRQWKDKGN